MKFSLPMSVKLILSNVSYIVPIGALIYFFTSVYQDNIGFAESELKGNIYQEKLETLFQNLGHHIWLPLNKENKEKSNQKGTSDLINQNGSVLNKCC